MTQWSMIEMLKITDWFYDGQETDSCLENANLVMQRVKTSKQTSIPGVSWCIQTSETTHQMAAYHGQHSHIKPTRDPRIFYMN